MRTATYIHKLDFTSIQFRVADKVRASFIEKKKKKPKRNGKKKRNIKKDNLHH